MNRSTARTLAVLGLVILTVPTVFAFLNGGPLGIFASIVTSWGSTQIFVDLVIAIVMICVWMYRDAKLQGRNPWPWIIGAFVVGSFSPLVYLLVRDFEDNS